MSRNFKENSTAKTIAGNVPILIFPESSNSHLSRKTDPRSIRPRDPVERTRRRASVRSKSGPLTFLYCGFLVSPTLLQRRSQGNHSIIKLAALILTSLMVFGEFVDRDPVVELTSGQFSWKGWHWNFQGKLRLERFRQ